MNAKNYSSNYTFQVRRWFFFKTWASIHVQRESQNRYVISFRVGEIQHSKYMRRTLNSANEQVHFLIEKYAVKGKYS